MSIKNKKYNKKNIVIHTREKRKKKKTTLLISIFSVCLAILLSLWFVGNHGALAHRPHDVVYEIEISPTYDQDQTLFVLVRGNLFRSTDGGFYWQRISHDLENRSDFSSISVSDQNKNVLFLSSPEDGIYKSVNAGESWTKVNQGLNTLNIDFLSISPQSDQLILAAGVDNGLYQTQDGGQTWSQVLNNVHHITAIEFANQKKIMIGDNQGNVYISEDEGKTWKPAFIVKESGAITAIAFSPNFSIDQTFWIGTEKGGIVKTNDNGLSFTSVNQGLSDLNIRDILTVNTTDRELTLFASTWTDGLFQSNDGGNNWQQDNKGITKDRQADDLSQPHFNNLVISNNFQKDKTIFLGGFNGLFKSTDGGRLWEELETLSPGTIVAMAVSPDYSNDSTVAAVTYVGETYISNDQGATWSPMNKGLEIPRFTGSFDEISINQDPRRFFDLEFSSNYGSDGTIFASILWSKFLISTNRGESWKIVPLNKEVRGITIASSPDFAQDKTIYLGNQKGIVFRSTDGGFNFSVIGNIGKVHGNDPPSLVISPDFSADNTLYASTAQGIHKSIDGGQTWNAVTTDPSLIDRKNIQLVISPNYASDRTVIVGTNRGILKTEDGGESWKILSGSTEIENGYIEGINISPNYSNDQTFIANVKGLGLVKTVDGGVTFTQIGNDSISLSRMNNVPSAYRSIQFSPSYANDNTIYGFGSAETELFKSTDGGNTWETLTIPRTIPAYEYKYDLLTTIDLMFYVYSSQVKKIIVALVASIFSYVILGFLRLEKKLKLPIAKLPMQIAGSATVFALALILLFV